MQAELWKRVEELYHAALAEAPEKRVAFLARACPDAQVRAEVQSLLDQADSAFLERSPMPSVVRPGLKLGNFEVIERIGRGGMGEVWLARDPRLKRDVAIKVLTGAFARDPERIARFEHEARAASALNHPNIVSVFDVGHENGVWWIVSELVEGEPLSALLGRGALPPRRVVDIASQIADGLAAAHAAGVVHRDLKPGNIMLRRDGRVKIVDFGLAKRRGAGADSATLTGSGAIMGTAGYMSPEQVRGEAVDPRSDIFSFGVILYEMLSGKQAFTGNSSVEVMNAILKGEPPELSGAPPQLERVVRHCLEKDRQRRFQSAIDIAFALESPPPSPRPEKSTRSGLPWIFAATALVLAVALGIWTMRSMHPLPTMLDGSFRRLTNDTGLTTDAAISPDGKFVAYASDRAEPSNLDIWVQPVDGGTPVRITDDAADDDEPAFSSDGSQIAFRSERSVPGIYIVSALGGDTRLLIPDGSRPRFSPDGQMLMYTKGLTGLFIQPLHGGSPVRIDEGCTVVNAAAWSPDSNRILFFAYCRDSTDLVWVSALDGKRVPARIRPNSLDEWLPSPPRILTAAQAGDGRSIIAVPISADGARVVGPPQRITFGTGNERHVAAASNGRLAISSGSSDPHIWAIPIDAGGHATRAPKQLTSGAWESRPVLSRDGRGLLFVSLPDSVLYYRDLDTKRQVQLSRTIGDTAVFSPDRSRIVFNDRDSNRGISFYEVSTSGGIPRKIWSAPHVPSFGAWDWSPDGAIILSGSATVCALDLATKKTRPFLEDSEYTIWEPHFSHDGQWVAFNAVRNGRSRLFVTPFRKLPAPGSGWIPIADSGWDDKPRFSYNDQLIFFTSDRDGHRCIWAQPVGADMHPQGSPFAVCHLHQRRKSLKNLDISELEIGAGPDTIVWDEPDSTGNVWLFEPAKSK